MEFLQTYGDNHEDTEVDKDTTIRISPVVDDSLLLHRQIIAHPREIREQTDNLLLRRKCRSEKLAQAEREVQSGNEHGHQARINETTNNGTN